jgi:hypothetical protein
MKPDGVQLGRRKGTPAALDGDDFRGLALASDATNVTLQRGNLPALWVHGGLKLDAGQLGRGDAYLGLLSLVIADETRLEARNSPILGDYLPGPDFDPAELDWSGRVAVECFHVELGAFFGLPAGAADYVVRAVLGPWSSNVVRIRVRVGA